MRHCLLKPTLFTLAGGVFTATFLSVDIALAQTVLQNPDPSVMEISIEVQEIAVLTVIDQNVSTVMDDPFPTSVGDPASFFPTPEMGRLELATNYCVGLQFDFPTVLGIRPNPTRFYGQAVGLSTSNTLGVQPFVRVENFALNFGNALNLSGSGNDAPLSLSAATGGLCYGLYDIFVGLVTQWDLTLTGEPIFAAPDTYRIPITVSLVP